MPIRIYKSDQAATLANTAPSAPSTGFNVTKLSEPSPGYAKVKVMWGSGSDTESAQRMLQYQLKMGTGTGLNNIVSGKTASPQYVSRVMPNGQSRNYVLTIPCDETYYWSVATRDTSLSLSGFSSEQSFLLDGSCTLTVLSGGGGGGGGGGNASTGGGFSWNIFRQGSEWNTPGITERAGWRTEAEMQKPTLLMGSVFLDTNIDGKRHPNEHAFRDGYSVTVAGTAWNGSPVKRSTDAKSDGSFAITLPASDMHGYHISLVPGGDLTYRRTTADDSATTDKDGLIRQTRKPSLDASSTTKEQSKEDERSIVIRSHLVVMPGAMVTLPDTGLIWASLTTYAPCLHVGAAQVGDPSTFDAVTLLARLTDVYSQPIDADISQENGLMTRRDFLRLLTRTQCLPLYETTERLHDALKKQAVGGKRTLTDLTLRDMPFGKLVGDAQIVYSLLASGIPAAKRTSLGLIADLDAPVTRRDAALMIDAALTKGGEETRAGTALPLDVDTDSSLAPAVRTLLDRDILPSWFRTHFGEKRGLERKEAIELLIRSAFADGHIALMDPSFIEKDAPRPTFLTTLPTFRVPRCDIAAQRDFTVSNVIPGDGIDSDIRSIIGLGATNDEGRTLWLLPGTDRTTEFGVTRGRARLEADMPVSLLDILRSLLVLSCTPPPSEATVRQWKGTAPLLGSAESRVPRDRVAGLPRTGSFASRVLYASQDRRREYDLSLYSYAPWLLRQSSLRSPGEAVTVREASEILASGILTIAVRAKALTPQEAEAKAESVALAIRQDLLSTSLDWRNDATGRNDVLTRGMLIRVLGTVAAGKRTRDQYEHQASLGEIWWERIMR